MRCVNTLLIASVLVLAIDPAARAASSSDWSKVKADIAQLPSGYRAGIPPVGSVPVPVLNEIRAKVQLPQGAPQRWVGVQIGEHPNLWQFQRRADGLLEQRSMTVYLEGGVNDPRASDPDYGMVGITDPLGLIDISREAPLFAADKPGGAIALVRVAISAPIGASDSILSTVQAHGVDGSIQGSDTPTHNAKVSDQSCTIEGSAAAGANLHCNWTRHESAEREDTESAQFAAHYQPYDSPYQISFVYLPEISYFLQAGFAADFVDYKVDGTPWHSQTRSAQLSPGQKQQARTLFARGFELYKAGDLAGARALVESGMRTDVGNYLAWFTLGEIARSATAQRVMGDWAADAWTVYYQHVIDLAPTSPEAALAAGYLKENHWNSNARAVFLKTWR